MIKLLKHNDADTLSLQSESALNYTDKLIVAVAKLRSENNFLRRKAKLQPYIRLVQQAKAAASLWLFGTVQAIELAE